MTATVNLHRMTDQGLGIRDEDGWPVMNPTETLPLRGIEGRAESTFKVYELLGSGEFGRIYKAEQTIVVPADNSKFSTQPTSTVQIKPCVLKVYKATLTEDPFKLRDEETHMLRTVKGLPHVIQYVEHFEDERIGPYLVMEPPCAESLKDYLKRAKGTLPKDQLESFRSQQHQGEKQTGRPPLTFTQAVKCIVQLMETVQQLHERKVVHNDLAPRNILFEQENKGLCVADFGIAKDAGKLRIDFPGKYNSAYMAPELWQTREGSTVRTDSDIEEAAPQVVNSEALKKSDVFAVGALALSLLSPDSFSRLEALAEVDATRSSIQAAKAYLRGLDEEQVLLGIDKAWGADTGLPKGLTQDLIAAILSLLRDEADRASLSSVIEKLGVLRDRLSVQRDSPPTFQTQATWALCGLGIPGFFFLGGFPITAAVLFLAILSYFTRVEMQRRLGERLCGVLITPTHVYRVGPALAPFIAAGLAASMLYQYLLLLGSDTISLEYFAAGVIMTLLAFLLTLGETLYLCCKTPDSLISSNRQYFVPEIRMFWVFCIGWLLAKVFWPPLGFGILGISGFYLLTRVNDGFQTFMTLLRTKRQRVVIQG